MKILKLRLKRKDGWRRTVRSREQERRMERRFKRLLLGSGR